MLSLYTAADSHLRQIKAEPPSHAILCMHARFTRRRNAMPVNVGTIDQYVRIVFGLALVAFALQDGLPIQGLRWAGLIGLVLLVTAFFRNCPLYTALGFSTCDVRNRPATLRRSE